jgi:alpha-beta hydrolase superfamily lysophospholipase
MLPTMAGVHTTDLELTARSALWPGDRAVVAGTVFADLPALAQRDDLTLVVAAPGGTYTRAYWHLEVPGQTGWSCAEYLAADGFVVFAFDQPSTGESSVATDPGRLRFEDVAAANADVAAQLAARARDGDLVDGLGPSSVVRIIGVGHSLGGQLTAVQQGLHRSFDAVAILGSSFLGNAQVGSDAAALAEGHLRVLAGDSYDGGLLRVPRDALRAQFHLPDVPPEVLREDDRHATVLPRQLALSAIDASSYHSVLVTIDVPVLLAYGDVDMSSDPVAEIALYQASRDRTLLHLSGSAHCHNTALTRQLLWRRLSSWISGIA